MLGSFTLHGKFNRRRLPRINVPYGEVIEQVAHGQNPQAFKRRFLLFGYATQSSDG